MTSYVTASHPAISEEEEFSDASESHPTDLSVMGDIASHYFGKYANKDGQADMTFGIQVYKHSDDSNKHMIENTEVFIKGNDFVIDGTSYYGTRGLWELIVSKEPNADVYNDNDMKAYANIMVATNAMQRDSDHNKPKSNKSFKYTYIIKPIWEKHKSTSDKGITLPLHATFLPSDPEALMSRLSSLFASLNAGNTGVSNEMLHVLDELKRLGKIDDTYYKRLNSLL